MSSSPSRAQGSPSSARHLGRRAHPKRTRFAALLRCGGLLVLWLLVQSSALVTPAAASDGAPHSAARSNAARSTPEQASPAGVTVFSWGNAAAVLLLACGGGYALYLRRRTPAAGTQAPLEPMGQFSLGPSQQLRLVGCGGEVLLMGVTEQEVTLLKTYPREAFAADSEGEGEVRSASAPALPSAFADVLGRFAGRDATA